MKTFFKTYFLPVLLVLLGTAAAVGILSGRVVREQEAKTYDIVMDYSSLQEMAEESDQPLEYWLQYFRELGVDKLGLREATAITLSKEQDGAFFLENPLTIRSSYGWEDRFPAEIAEIIRQAKEGDVLGICTDPERLKWVLENYAQRCETPINVFYGADGTGFFLLTSDEKDVNGHVLASLSLGVLPEELTLAEQYGYTVIPRTLPVAGLNDSYFAADVMADYRELDVPYMIGGGEGIVGFDDIQTLLPELLDFLKTENITLGVVETSQQSLNLEWEGLSDLVIASGYDAVRVFSMWDYIQSRYAWYGYEGPEEITNSLYRAAYERGCRIIYLKMITDEESGDYITDPAAYDALITGFIQRMNSRGYTYGTVSPASPYAVSFPLAVLVAMGAVAAAVLLMMGMINLPSKWMYLILIGGSICAAGVLFVMPNTGRIILSIGSGIVLPALAAVLLMRHLTDRASSLPLAVEGLLAVLFSALIAMMGAAYACAPLSDSSFMLEMELYRGVKIMQLAPLAVFVCCFIKLLWGKSILRTLNSTGVPAPLKKLSGMPLKTILLRLAVIAVVVAITVLVGKYYVARTGHTGNVEVSDLEMQFRAFMENTLPARPRTKEFLVGYPCILLFVWAMRKKLPLFGFFFGLGAVIGLTSIVNTFLHIRTTFLLSLTRVGIGLGFGLVIGLTALALAELLYRLVMKKVHHV